MKRVYMNYTKAVLLTVVCLMTTKTVVFSQTLSPTLTSTPIKRYLPIQEKKWNMLSAYRWHVQDFSTTDINDSCNCVTDGKFLDKANANVGLSLYRNFSKRFAGSFDVMVGYGTISRKLGNSLDKTQLWMNTVRGDLYYHFTNPSSQLQPYLFTAIHASSRSSSYYVTSTNGLGMRFMFFNNNGMLTAQLGHGVGLTNRLRNNIILSSGLYISLGKKKKTVTEINNEIPVSNCKYPLIDSDCDGIVDSLDACPTLPGALRDNGCPCATNDSDGDGVEDSKDRCPTVAGSPANQGCPASDRDKDGILDQDDFCPDVPGIPANQGCPLVDTDKDGIPDKWDLCPEIPGIASKQGCPETTAPTNRYEEEPRYILYFDFDKYYLTDRSKSTLNDLADYLKSNPGRNCVLVGHTDEKGSIPYNVALSSNRVNTAKAYLLGKRISDTRISTDYRGKKEPVVKTVDNAVAERNRRVEIYLIAK